MLVVFSDGTKVELSHIPPKLRDIVNTKYPLPEMPIVESKAVTGEMIRMSMDDVIRMSMDDDVDYLAEKARVEKQRDEAWQEAYTLAAMKKVKVPDGFDIMEEWGDELEYLDPDWKPRAGRIGRKLDYIEFVLLACLSDQLLVSEKINEMMGIDEEVTDSIEDSFPGDVSEEGD
jgi:hypothetical protein